MLDPAAEAAQLLPQLLAVWRETREPRVADLVDRVAAQLPARPVLYASKRKADLAAWRELAEHGDPADFARLAAAARGGGQHDVVRQVATLAAREDPRLGAALLALLEKPPYAGVRSRGMLEAIVAALRDTRDPRLVEPMCELAGRYLGIVNSSTGTWLVRELEAAAAGLASLTPPPPLDAAVAERVAALEARFGRRIADVAAIAGKRTLAQLLAEVYAAPDDDGPRLVYADALTERGDPRGEFIVLQIAKARGTLTDDGLVRLTEIERDDKQLAAWAQPLAKAGRCGFERGFPVRISLSRTGAPSIIGDPAWATIREVAEIGALTQKIAIALLDHAAAVGIRRVDGLTPGLLAKLCGRPRAWTAVRIVGDVGVELTTVFANLPALETLDLWLGRLPLVGFLASLRVRSLVLRCEVPLPADPGLPPTIEKLELHPLALPDGLVLDGLARLTHITIVTRECGPLRLPASVEDIVCDVPRRRLPAIETPPDSRLTRIEAVGSLWAGVFRRAPRLRELAILGVSGPIPDGTFDPLVELEQLHCQIDALPRLPSGLPLRRVTTWMNPLEQQSLCDFVVRYPDLERLSLEYVGDRLRDPAGWQNEASTVWTAVAATRIRHLRLVRRNRIDIIDLVRDPATGELPPLPT